MKKLAALLLLGLNVRCASLVHGRYQQLAVRSTPAGAAVRVDCGHAPSSPGVTPVSVTLQRGAERCSITMSMPGYSDQTVTFQRARSRVAFANLGGGLAFGLAAGIGAAVGSPLDDSNTPNSVAIGGIAVGTGLGLLVDHKTGALYRQMPDSVDVSLQPSDRFR